MQSSATSTAPLTTGHVELMDRMYALQRHCYDATRKYYLFGRDRLIDNIPISSRQHVAEIGCGTGRNLAMLARKHPRAHFYGVDAANVMIDTAKKKLSHASVHLRQGLAEDLHARDWFNITAFDRIFFSYSLSMIPTWQDALEAALANLAPGGQLWIVDFWDQSGYPRPFALLLKQWLKLFHVHHRPELLGYLQTLEEQGRGAFSLKPIGRRYGFLGCFIKRGGGTVAA